MTGSWKERTKSEGKHVIKILGSFLIVCPRSTTLVWSCSASRIQRRSQRPSQTFSHEQLHEFPCRAIPPEISLIGQKVCLIDLFYPATTQRKWPISTIVSVPHIYILSSIYIVLCRKFIMRRISEHLSRPLHLIPPAFRQTSSRNQILIVRVITKFPTKSGFR